MSFYYKPYVPVAKRREKALKKMAKLKKKGVDIQPVEIQGRKISKTFWGNAWCDHIERFCDIDNRLPRGRTYVRNGSVCHLNIEPGKIQGIVSGSELYNVEIHIEKLTKKKWQEIKKTCSGKVGSILEILQGTMSSSVMEIVTEPDDGLMPRLGEMKFKCNCPDWADMCKHVAAVLYGVGARLDIKPEMLFELRGVDPSELVDSVDIPDADTSTELEGDLSSLFGVEIEPENVATPIKRPKTKAKSATSKAKKKAPTKKVSSKKFAPKREAKKPKSAKTTRPKTKQSKADIKPFKPTKTAIKKLRKRFDLNKTQFAKLVSVSPATITSWEDKPGRITLKPASEEALIKVSALTKEQAWKRVGLQ